MFSNRYFSISGSAISAYPFLANQVTPYSLGCYNTSDKRISLQVKYGQKSIFNLKRSIRLRERPLLKAKFFSIA